MLSVPVLLPVPSGVKVRMTVQEPETAIVPPLAHVPPDRAKSVPLAPVIVKKGVERTSAPVPMFETVTVNPALVVFCNWFPKAPGLGEKLSTGTAGTTPVPVSATLSGLVAALVVNVKLAVLLAAVVGVKTTFKEHEAPATRLAPHVLLLVLNSAALAPVRVMLVIVSVDVPVLVRVTAWFPLDVFMV